MTEEYDRAVALIAGIGQRVKARREAAGLTQSQLDRNARLRPATIAKLERGEDGYIEVTELDRVATVLGCAIVDLLPDEPQ
jgi:transcriptional regulator with XRE-family HTH domain